MPVSVIFHVDECVKWSLLLKNVANLLEAVRPETARIEVLANAEAVKQYVPGEAAPNLQAMRELAGRGVRFAACGNALKGLNIPYEQLAPFVQVVPSGVLELAERQAQNYAYIKP